MLPPETHHFAPHRTVCPSMQVDPVTNGQQRRQPGDIQTDPGHTSYSPNGADASAFSDDLSCVLQPDRNL